MNVRRSFDNINLIIYTKLALIYLEPFHTNNNEPLQYMLPVTGADDDVIGNPNILPVDSSNEPVTEPVNEPVITALELDTLMASLLNVPNLTESSDDTANIGIPEMSFTENKDPDSWSVTENN